MSSAPVTTPYDVIIIGAGVVGCAVARELSRYQMRAAVLEREYDVAEATSKANSAILHIGFDAPVGSLEAELLVEGRRLWDEAAASLHVPINRTGALLVAFDDAQVQVLVALQQQGARNGVYDLRTLSRGEALSREPHLNPEVRAALLIPGESITDPFGAVIALAEHAAINGVEFHLGRTVDRISRVAVGYQIAAGESRYEARWLVNAAGLYSDEVARLAGRNGVAVRPRKGEFLIFDKPARRLISHIVLPVPTRTSKGILVAPTIFGNVLAGPTAVDQEDKTDQAVSPEGLEQVRVGIRRLVPALDRETVIATYAGLRAVGSCGDYLIEVDGRTHLVTISGIRSTGLSSALAIARRVVAGMAETGLRLQPRGDYRPERPRPPWMAGGVKPCFDPASVARDPAFGRVVCLCERTSEGEILAVLGAPIPATTLDAVKKRTWAMAGPCQGYFCTAALIEIMARELGIPPWRVTKRGPGSEFAFQPLTSCEGIGR